MPQLSQISEIFASQLFWLIVTFGLVYLVIGRGMVPKIESTVDSRDRRIADDLAEAERARARADEIEEANRARTEENRAEALKVTQRAKEAAARDNERKLAAADAEIGATLGSAEQRIRAATRAAMAEIEEVSTEAAREMVERLAGVRVPRERAAQAVKAVLETENVHG